MFSGVERPACPTVALAKVEGRAVRPRVQPPGHRAAERRPLGICKGNNQPHSRFCHPTARRSPRGKPPGAAPSGGGAKRSRGGNSTAGCGLANAKAHGPRRHWTNPPGGIGGARRSAPASVLATNVRVPHTKAPATAANTRVLHTKAPANAANTRVLHTFPRRHARPTPACHGVARQREDGRAARLTPPAVGHVGRVGRVTRLPRRLFAGVPATLCPNGLTRPTRPIRFVLLSAARIRVSAISSFISHHSSSIIFPFPRLTFGVSGVTFLLVLFKQTPHPLFRSGASNRSWELEDWPEMLNMC